jgi:hypothetical protein
MISMSQNTKQWVQAGALSVLLALPSLAMAAGGLGNITQTVESWTQEIVTLYGVCAVLYLLYKIVQVKSGRESMMDLAWACIWIVAAGAATWGATELFNAGKGAK